MDDLKHLLSDNPYEVLGVSKDASDAEIKKVIGNSLYSGIQIKTKTIKKKRRKSLFLYQMLMRFFLNQKKNVPNMTNMVLVH